MLAAAAAHGGGGCCAPPLRLVMPAEMAAAAAAAVPLPGRPAARWLAQLRAARPQQHTRPRLAGPQLPPLLLPPAPPSASSWEGPLSCQVPAQAARPAWPGRRRAWLLSAADAGVPPPLQWTLLPSPHRSTPRQTLPQHRQQRWPWPHSWRHGWAVRHEARPARRVPAGGQGSQRAQTQQSLTQRR